MYTCSLLVDLNYVGGLTDDIDISEDGKLISTEIHFTTCKWKTIKMRILTSHHKIRRKIPHILQGIYAWMAAVRILLNAVLRLF